MADDLVGGARDKEADAAHHSRRPVSARDRSLMFRA